MIELVKSPNTWILNKKLDIKEIDLIRFFLNDYHRKLNETKKLEEEIKIKEAINEMAIQIAHDLRSPIVALKTVTNHSKFDLDTYKKILIIAFKE